MTDYSGLLSYSHTFNKCHVLECWLEYEGADLSVGLSESWSVFYAYLGGVDIVELLSEDVLQEIILGAMQYCADEAAQP